MDNAPPDIPEGRLASPLWLIAVAVILVAGMLSGIFTAANSPKDVSEIGAGKATAPYRDVLPAPGLSPADDYNVEERHEEEESLEGMD